MYKHLFFDLDRTLWDFEKNSHEVLLELYKHYDLLTKGIVDSKVFIERYKHHNEKLWDLYRQNKIEKDKLRDERFKITLNEFGINSPKLAANLGEDYVAHCPKKTNLFPYVHSTLNYLKDRYALHIITNGFEEVQYQKLENSNLIDYFEQIITSEQVGFKKPSQQIFKFSMLKAFAKPSDSLMIGDDLHADILGAKDIGMAQVFFNPLKHEHANSEITYEINCLSELEEIL
ncbi:MAG: noncanonical pyrimidine nucleotidase, YjjG family [Flavobacteriia bacterium]|nr:noncanonical pyrimidine nucleotidase, YjjG family [Flavobacteriia bacterium]